MTVKPPDGTAAADGAAFAEAHREMLADGSIQFELPTWEPPEPPAWLEWLSERLDDAPSLGAPPWLRSVGDFFDGAAPGLGTFFYVALGLLVLAALYFIARFVLNRRRRRRPDEAEERGWRPEAGPAQQLLGEADALAARGLFSEAAHLLLFRSIEDIDARRPDLVRPAFTSRDIAGLDAIPGPPRSAFARIAMNVERSLFAQRPLAEEDWRDCRAAYREFAFADGWRG